MLGDGDVTVEWGSIDYSSSSLAVNDRGKVGMQSAKGFLVSFK